MKQSLFLLFFCCFTPNFYAQETLNKAKVAKIQHKKPDIFKWRESIASLSFKIENPPPWNGLTSDPTDVPEPSVGPDSNPLAQQVVTNLCKITKEEQKPTIPEDCEAVTAHAPDGRIFTIVRKKKT